MSYIDSAKDRFGVQSICKVLQFAPSTYYAAKSATPSKRAQRDEELKGKIARVHAENFSVYGAEKLSHAMRREGTVLARCTVERLMRELGLKGARRGRGFVRTTVADDAADRPSDLLKRDFSAKAPNRLWVADLTYVRTRQGWAYTSFVVDVFARMIVGWRVSSSLHAEIATDALEQAIASRVPVPGQLTHHSDRLSPPNTSASATRAN